MTVAGVAAFEHRKQEVNAAKQEVEHRKQEVNAAAKQEVISILSIEGSTPLGTTHSLTTAAEWTGVSVDTFCKCLNSDDGILRLHGKPLYRLNIVSNDVAVGKTDEGVAAFERRKQEVNAAKQEVISILSMEGSTPLGTTHSFATAAEWTGVSERSVRECLTHNDGNGILTFFKKPLYRISKGKVTDDDVSFGMTVAGVAAFECRKQEVNRSAGVDQKPIAKKRKKIYPCALPRNHLVTHFRPRF